jgi:hypothetical protein
MCTDPGSYPVVLILWAPLPFRVVDFGQLIQITQCYEVASIDSGMQWITKVIQTHSEYK